MATKYKHLPLTNDLANLNLADIEDNLFNYSYHSSYLTKLLNKKFDQEDPHYISTYSSFIGEVYENVIYELLLRYAIDNKDITRFVLKGPHQNGHKNEKNGLLIDVKDQIVYKSGYKDVSEFDGLFFADEYNELWFVESTIIKTTTSLKKRLKKKKALLQLIFPTYIIRSLIILCDGVMGANTFPSYCTVWITKQLDNTELINKLIDIKNQPKRDFTKFNAEKLIETKDIKIAIYKYFETLSWILKKTRTAKNQLVDLEFLNSLKIETYFDICSKLYIGYITTQEFKNIYPQLPLEGIDEDKICVTIEKMKIGFELFYYAKLTRGKLKKIEILKDGELKISDKDPKGFTASETKYMKYIWKSHHSFLAKDIVLINKDCKLKRKTEKLDQKKTKKVKAKTKTKIDAVDIKKREIYALSDRKMKDVNNLPTFEIKFIQSEIDLSSYDAIIFTSKNGVFSLDSFDDTWKDKESYAISLKTAQCIEKSGGKLQYTGLSGHGNNFAEELIPLLKDKKVLYIKPKVVVSKLMDILVENDINCDALITYETVCKPYDMSNKPPKDSIIILSSPSTLNCFLDTFGWDDSYLAIVIGRTTTKFIPDYINYKVSKYTSLDSCVKLARTFQEIHTTN